VFADCTGDGTVGYLAGADYRLGREARNQTGESRAVEKADTMTMGTSIMWYAVDGKEDFPATPWALRFDSRTVQKLTRGNWDWETGMMYHQVDDFEYVRDYGLRAVYGNWSQLKNGPETREEFADKKLGWVAYIGGKRESRRLMGDVILKQQDIVGRKEFQDACVVTTWSIDLHYPVATKGMKAEPFRSTARHTRIEPYAFPYRCLYSRNIDNLFMAGRNISVTHVALGTVRVMRTTGLMGEVVGLAAGLCKKHDTTPRGVYKDHLDEFNRIMGKQPRLGADDDVNLATSILEKGQLRTADRYKLIDIPDRLEGAVMVTIPRGRLTAPGASYRFAVDKAATVYLAVHTRGDYEPGAPWKPTNLTIKWDKGSDRVYVAEFAAGIVEVPAHSGRNGPKGRFRGLPHMAIVASTEGRVEVSSVKQAPATEADKNP
jgi:hypothetical protein